MSRISSCLSRRSSCRVGSSCSGWLILPRVEHALRDFKAALSRYQGLGTLLEVVVEAGPVLPHDGGHVPEAGGDQQGHLGPLALQDGVGGHGGAVYEEPYRLGGNLELAQDPTGALDDGRAGPIGRAGNLQQPEVSLLLVKADDVGKGTPDVDSDSDRHDSPMRVERYFRRNVGAPSAKAPLL